MKEKIKGSSLLLLTTMIWGFAFVAQSVGMDHVGPFTFQAIRCTMAVIGLIPIIWLFDRKKKDGKTFLTRFWNRKFLKAGLCCSLPLFAAASLQQIGIVYTDAGKSAFLTAMYIVFVPVIGFFFGKKPSPMVPFSVLLAVIGLYFLSCMGVSAMNIGDLFLLGCAVAFAVQICFVDKFAADADPLRLNLFQCLFCAAASAVIAFFTETVTMQGIAASWWPMCYAGFLSMGAAYSFQIIGQKHIEPSLASLIMSLESVFAVLSGWLFLHETLSPPEAAGCVLVLAAVILAQIPVKKKA